MKSNRYSLLLVGLALLLLAFTIGCGQSQLEAYKEGYKAGLAPSQSPTPTVTVTTTPKTVTVTPPPKPPVTVTITAPASPTPTPTSKTSQSSNIVEAQVTRVIDGDTIEVSIAGKTYTVRYIGIDTPETVQPFGPEASTKNKELVGGEVVRLEKDVSETDNYSRLLRYVYVGDLFVNAELVRLGYARPVKYPPDTKYHETFVRLEAQARLIDVIGIWSPKNYATYKSTGSGYQISYPQSWELHETSPGRVLLFGDGRAFTVIEIQAIKDWKIKEAIAVFPDYMKDVYKKEWSNLTITKSNQIYGKWNWVMGFKYTDILSPPLTGIGEVYFLDTPNTVFTVQWSDILVSDGSAVLSDECKRIIDTFTLLK